MGLPSSEARPGSLGACPHGEENRVVLCRYHGRVGAEMIEASEWFGKCWDFDKRLRVLAECVCHDLF